MPYDFSESSRQAARYACEFGRRFGAAVTLLHVLPPFRYEFAMTEPSDERLRQVNQQRATQARAALAELGLRYEVIEGDPAQEIVGASNSGEYDAIVMSTLGAGAFRRWLMIGSVTAKVLHASERPVITGVHFESATSPENIRKILCAIDLGKQSARILCWAHRAARSLNASLLVGHAASGSEVAHIADGEGWRDAQARQLTEEVDNLKRSLQVDAETHVRFGAPARAISELASQSAADLVILGRGESQDLIGRLRANAYDIIRQCPCPVVSV